MKFVVITKNSVYTVISRADGNFVMGRASFGHSPWLNPTEHYSGKVVTDPFPGERMVFIDPLQGQITTSAVLQVIAL